MQVSYQRIELPLERVFTIARGSRSLQRSLVVELEHQGQRGFGEATEHEYYGVTCDAMINTLERCRSIIESFDGAEPAALWNRLYPKLCNETFVLAAIDSAAYDLVGKLVNKPTFELLGLEWNAIPNSSFTIGIDTIDQMVNRVLERMDWPVLKIKLGTDQDVEIIRQLRAHTSALFRVDANCAWTVEETIENSRHLKDQGVEFIEQPLPAGADDRDHKAVFQNSALPIIADESCLVESDVQECLDRFHGVNVKLSKCGGITPALRMLRQAKAFGMKTMIGCMVESSVGISAAATVASIVGLRRLRWGGTFVS